MHPDMKSFNAIWREETLLNPHGQIQGFWVRFHTLPDSKRYPETEAESQTIVTRHYQLLKELKGDQLVAITSEWTASPKPSASISGFNADAFFWRTIKESVSEEDPSYRHLYVKRIGINSPFLDELIRAVANDKEAGVFLTPPDFSWLYHPYDGGCDIILTSEALRDKLKSKYSSWLSASPDGL